jgi:hypothetical protein
MLPDRETKSILIVGNLHQVFRQIQFGVVLRITIGTLAKTRSLPCRCVQRAWIILRNGCDQERFGNYDIGMGH